MTRICFCKGWWTTMTLLVVVLGAFGCESPNKPYSVLQTDDGQHQILWYDEVIHETENRVSGLTSLDWDEEEALIWDERSYDGQKKTFYAPSALGKPLVYESDYRIYTKQGPLLDEPLLDSLSLEKQDRCGLDEHSIYLVQFKTPLGDFYRRLMRLFRVKMIQPAPSQAALVYGTARRLFGLRDSGMVHRVVLFDPSWKLQPGLFETWTQPTEKKTLTLFASHPEAFEWLRDRLIADKDFDLLRADPILNTYTVRTNKNSLESWLPSPLLLWVEIFDNDIGFDMDNARVQGGADAIENELARYPAEFTGIGIRGHVLEGIDPEHPDLAANEYRQAPIAIDNGEVAAHGHKTYGIIFGSGEGNIKARGVLPNAQGFYTNYVNLFLRDPDNLTGESRYGLVKRLVDDHQVMFQTASWGHTSTLDYNLRSLELDRVIFDLDIPITQSQSNNGTQLSRPQAWSKNVISVGAIHHFESADPTDDRWDPGWGGRASIGPASDGRIKPDLVAYFDSTETVAEGGGYTQFGGTSGATPIIAGYLGLVMEMWTSGVLGNELAFPIEERFKNRPHESTARALLIHSAEQYPFSGIGNDMSRFHQGWGFPNLKKLMAAKERLVVVDEKVSLGLGDKHEILFDVKEGDKELVATLVYSDPPPNPTSSRALVNDLNLRLTAPDGKIYVGNWGLIEGMQSQPLDEVDRFDRLNPVERFILNDPFPGQWKIEVIASEVAIDGHLKTEEIDTVFSLAVSAH